MIVLQSVVLGVQCVILVLEVWIIRIQRKTLKLLAPDA